MNNQLTEIVFVLDRSGSMHGMEADTVGGFNSVLEKQKQEPGKALVSTVLFNHAATVLHDRVPLEDMKLMTVEDFRVGGSTALVDALGGAIHHIGMIHKYARPEDVPAHTIFVIMTDGMENASHCYTADKLRSMIRKEKEEYGWEFIFLAANIDAVETASHYGIDRDTSVNYRSDPIGADVSFEAIHRACCAVRNSRSIHSEQEWRTDVDEDFRTR